MKHNAILLVEDNPDDEYLTVRALHRSKVLNEIVIARDGAEALEYMFGRGKYEGRDATDFPAMVLLDLRLPKIDGIEVLRQIRADERTKLTPVVVLTSSQEAQHIVTGYGLGVNSYVRKPVGFDQFASAVNAIGLYWLVLNEPPTAGVASQQLVAEAVQRAGGG